MISSAFYPIGTPGTPWGAAEVAAWRARQTRKRSHADEVQGRIEALRARFDVVEYGRLDVAPEHYPLLAVKSRDWNAALPLMVVTGGVHGFAQAEELLASDRADVVGFARASLADPDWFVKVRTGHGDAVSMCIYANYCEALDERHEEVTCQLWDRAALDEPGIRKTKDGKRRLTPPAWVAPE